MMTIGGQTRFSFRPNVRLVSFCAFTGHMAHANRDRRVAEDRRKASERPAGWVTYIENNLIEELHRITAEHDGDNVPIDLATQSLELRLGGSGLGDIAVRVEELPGGVDVGAGDVVAADGGLGEFGLLEAFLGVGHVSSER